MEHLIKVMDLCKIYNPGENEVRALDHVNLEIDRGEFVAIIGQSGSGKSTFLRSLNLLEVPTGGQILFEGTDITDKKVNIDEVRQRIGMVFQNFNLFPNMTVLDNITLAPMRLKKLSKEEANKKAEGLLDRVGLLDKKDSYPSQLSGGQKQRIAIARALAMEPDMMLFDEPTSALDPELVGEVEKSIVDAAKSGQTMILVSPDMNFIYQVADKVLFLEKGHILEQGTPDEIFNHPKEERTKEFFASYSKQYL